MRFLLNINQKKSIDWGLNINESVIFSVIYDAPNWAQEVVIQGKAYYFVSRNKICKELPLIGFKPDTVYRYVKKLQSKGLIDWEKDYGKDCIRLTKKGRSWNYVKTLGQPSDNSDTHPNNSDTHPNLLGQPSESNSDSHPTYTDTNIYTDTNYTDTSNKENVEQQKIAASTRSEPESGFTIISEKKEPLPPRETRSNKYKDEIREVVEHLNDCTGRNFDPGANKNSKYIRGRIKEGATIEKMKEVIDLKCKEWMNDPKMKFYLRPQTLFNRTKYEEYRDQWKSDKRKNEALESLRNVVNEFVTDNDLVFVWSSDEIESLSSIATNLKKVMKAKGDKLTMENLGLVLREVLERLDDFYINQFSLNLINKKFNSIINGNREPSQDREWKEFTKRINEYKSKVGLS